MAFLRSSSSTSAARAWASSPASRRRDARPPEPGVRHPRLLRVAGALRAQRHPGPSRSKAPKTPSTTAGTSTSTSSYRSGPTYLWLKSNKLFVDAFRKQMLIWRAFGDKMIDDYIEKGKRIRLDGDAVEDRPGGEPVSIAMPAEPKAPDFELPWRPPGWVHEAHEPRHPLRGVHPHAGQYLPHARRRPEPCDAITFIALILWVELAKLTKQPAHDRGGVYRLQRLGHGRRADALLHYALYPAYFRISEVTNAQTFTTAAGEMKTYAELAPSWFAPDRTPS